MTTCWYFSPVHIITKNIQFFMKKVKQLLKKLKYFCILLKTREVTSRFYYKYDTYHFI